MVRIEGNAQGALAQGSFTPSGMQAQTGTFRGEQVTVKDAASALADAAEEISLHHSEKVESKKHEERRIEGETPVRVMLVEQINAYLEAAKTFSDPQKLADLAKRMQSGQDNPRELARQQSRDPSHQYVLLQHALADGQAKGAPAPALERLQDAIADLEMEAGPQIRAGLNTIGIASSLGGSAEEIAAFQSNYRDVVLGDNSLAQTLKLVLERMTGKGSEDFSRDLGNLIKALGADLSAARPSTDSNRLQAMVQDLYQLEVIVTVMDGCKELVAKTGGSGGTAASFELTKELVAVTGEKWVGSARFVGMADRLNVHDIGARIAFQTGIKSLLREIPPKVFPDPDVRQSIIGAAQEALDLAIDQEEQ